MKTARSEYRLDVRRAKNGAQTENIKGVYENCMSGLTRYRKFYLMSLFSWKLLRLGYRSTIVSDLY